MGFIQVQDRIQISAVVFQEGDAWVAQGLEYDIAAHAPDMLALPHAFMRALIENAQITMHLGRAPLAGVPRAPKKFHEMSDRATFELRPVGAISDRIGTAVPDLTMRVIEREAA